MLFHIFVIFSIFLCCSRLIFSFSFFFFNDTATTEIYTLSLHDALPILLPAPRRPQRADRGDRGRHGRAGAGREGRSEEHTSELQSRLHLVCRLLLEKKKNIMRIEYIMDRWGEEQRSHTTAGRRVESLGC